MSCTVRSRQKQRSVIEEKCQRTCSRSLSDLDRSQQRFLAVQEAILIVTTDHSLKERSIPSSLSMSVSTKSLTRVLFKALFKSFSVCWTVSFRSVNNGLIWMKDIRVLWSSSVERLKTIASILPLIVISSIAVAHSLLVDSTMRLTKQDRSEREAERDVTSSRFCSLEWRFWWFCIRSIEYLRSSLHISLGSLIVSGRTDWRRREPFSISRIVVRMLIEAFRRFSLFLFEVVTVDWLESGSLFRRAICAAELVSPDIESDRSTDGTDYEPSFSSLLWQRLTIFAIDQSIKSFWIDSTMNISTINDWREEKFDRRNRSNLDWSLEWTNRFLCFPYFLSGCFDIFELKNDRLLLVDLTSDFSFSNEFSRWRRFKRTRKHSFVVNQQPIHSDRNSFNRAEYFP